MQYLFGKIDKHTIAGTFVKELYCPSDGPRIEDPGDTAEKRVAMLQGR